MMRRPSSQTCRTCALVSVRALDSGEHRGVPAAALFVLIGAEPRTGWLAVAVARDSRGYVLTGRDLLRGGVSPGGPMHRRALLLETSMPGVFAAGDVRHQAIKRVVAAAGEGAGVVQLVHEYLAGDAAP